MTRTMGRWVAIAFVAAVIAACGAGEDSAGVVIDEAWARATPPDARMGAAYLTIEAIGELDRVTAVSTPVAAAAEIHSTEVAEGLSSMRPIGILLLEPGKPIRLEPGGIHIMLMGLEQPLVAGQTFTLTLHLEKRGNIDVEVAVRSPGA